MENKPAKYVCGACGYVYDPEVGDEKNKVAPGTPFESRHGTDDAELPKSFGIFTGRSFNAGNAVCKSVPPPSRCRPKER
ncbi:MAG: rubredoxin, partial [Firmicutes bacterium]|nr:rubredoxin [Bacillota bacterium]